MARVGWQEYALDKKNLQDLDKVFASVRILSTFPVDAYRKIGRVSFQFCLNFVTDFASKWFWFCDVTGVAR